MTSLTREVIVEALGLLADRLRSDEPRVDLIIVGGAAMVLLFGARESTKDVDGFQLDLEAGPRVAEAAAVADARRLLKECRGTGEEVWREVEPFVVPGLYLVRAAETMPRLRRSCETEGPESLRVRRIYAPPDFLTVA